MQLVCADTALDSSLLDCNFDDYNTHPAPGSYLNTHWNSANIRFLIVGADVNPAPPPVTAPPPTARPSRRPSANAKGKAKHHRKHKGNDKKNKSRRR